MAALKNKLSNLVPGKLFVGGLSFETSDEKLNHYFSRFGNVADTVVMRDPATRRSRGFGFVTFSDVSSAENVMMFHEHIIDARKVETKWAVPREATANLSSSLSGTGSMMMNSGMHSYLRGPVNNGSVMNSHPNNVNDMRGVGGGGGGMKSGRGGGGGSDVNTLVSKKIFIGGLHYETTDDSLRLYFEQYGPVDNAQVLFNRDTNKSRGFGFVTFIDYDSAYRALSARMHTIDGKDVEIKLAVPKVDLSAPSASIQIPSNNRGGMNDGMGYRKRAATTTSVPYMTGMPFVSSMVHDYFDGVPNDNNYTIPMNSWHGQASVPIQNHYNAYRPRAHTAIDHPGSMGGSMPHVSVHGRHMMHPHNHSHIDNHHYDSTDMTSLSNDIDLMLLGSDNAAFNDSSVPETVSTSSRDRESGGSSSSATSSTARMWNQAPLSPPENGSRGSFNSISPSESFLESRMSKSPSLSAFSVSSTASPLVGGGYSLGGSSSPPLMPSEMSSSSFSPFSSVFNHSNSYTNSPFTGPMRRKSTPVEFENSLYSLNLNDNNNAMEGSSNNQKESVGGGGGSSDLWSILSAPATVPSAPWT